MELDFLTDPAFEDYRKRNERNVQIAMASKENTDALMGFYELVKSWKQKAMFAQTQMAKDNGYVLEARPVPLDRSGRPVMEKVFNEAKFNDFWERVHHNGERLPDHYFVDFKPFVFPESIWQLSVPNAQPKTDATHPVGGRDQGAGKGWFYNVGGDSFKPDAPWEDPVSGLDYKLAKFRDNPFDPDHAQLRWGLVGVATFPDGTVLR